jgi:Adenylate kinase and related kinases
VNIIIFGPPGAGKGTQAKYLVKKLNNFQISTGDMLRDEINKNTEIGKKIINYMNEGKFVEDEIVNKLLEKIIFDPKKKNKLIFDGYPRTVNQAKNLEVLLNKSEQNVEFIFFLNVNKDAVLKRIEKRKILEKRSDDDADTILKRYDTYMDITKPRVGLLFKKPKFS